MKRKELGKITKIVAGVLAAATLVMPITASAAPVRVAVGPDSSIYTLFDADYYAANNPDVVAALGSDPEVLKQHYINSGWYEGRKGYLVLSDEEIQSRIYAQQVNYPEGMAWGSQDYTRSELPVPGNVTSNIRGASGFSIRISNAVFGDDTPAFWCNRTPGHNLQWYVDSFDDIRPGDILEYYYNNGQSLYSVMVISNNGDSLTVCEGSRGGKVHWNDTITLLDGNGHSTDPYAESIYLDDIYFVIKRQIADPRDSSSS